MQRSVSSREGTSPGTDSNVGFQQRILSSLLLLESTMTGLKEQHHSFGEKFQVLEDKVVSLIENLENNPSQKKATLPKELSVGIAKVQSAEV